MLLNISQSEGLHGDGRNEYQNVVGNLEGGDRLRDGDEV
jgi:hypothetical protein